MTLDIEPSLFNLLAVEECKDFTFGGKRYPRHHARVRDNQLIWFGPCVFLPGHCPVNKGDKAYTGMRIVQ